MDNVDKVMDVAYRAVYLLDQVLNGNTRAIDNAAECVAEFKRILFKERSKVRKARIEALRKEYVE